MKHEKQVSNLELSKELKLLGVKQDSLHYYYRTYDEEQGDKQEYINKKWVQTYQTEKYELHSIDSEWSGNQGVHDYSAFSVAELGEMLPKDILVGEESYGHLIVMKGYNVWHCVYDGDYRTTSRDTLLANAMAKMLIWCIENKKVKI